MNPEERSLLERTYKMAEENNEILKSIRRYTRFGTAIKIFYWVIIIGLSVGSIYFIQPLINALSGELGGSKPVDTGEVSPLQSYTENVRDLLN